MSRCVTKVKGKAFGSRKTYDDKLKLQVVLEALRETMPLKVSAQTLDWTHYESLHDL